MLTGISKIVVLVLILFMTTSSFEQMNVSFSDQILQVNSKIYHHHHTYTHTPILLPQVNLKAVFACALLAHVQCTYLFPFSPSAVSALHSGIVTTMALNIPGVVAVVVFYIMILATGVWAAQKSRKAERKSHGDRTEVVLLGDRNISLLVGVFTMTGKSLSDE